MKTPHTSCPRGQRVRVELRDGTEIYDKFRERTGKWVILDNHKLKPGHIKAFTIIKGGMAMLKLLDVYHAGGIRPGALEYLYELMKAREPEVNISHREMPSFEQHRQYVTRRPYRFWYLIERQGQGTFEPAWIGFISVTENNEIGIVLGKNHRGNGFGPMAISMLMSMHRPNPAVPGARTGRWLANIAPANERSLRTFARLGFRKIQETFEFQSEEVATDGQG